MSASTLRIVVPAEGPDVAAIEAALDLCDGISRKCHPPRDVILFVPTKGRLEGTTLESALGTSAVKALEKGEAVSLPGGASLRLVSGRTWKGFFGDAIILAVYPSKGMLDQADSAVGPSAIVVVPWIMAELEGWIKAWNPEIVGRAASPKAKLIDNPVVENALRSLTGRVNLGTGVSHPSDKTAAVQMFRILMDSGEHYDPNSIRSWALRNRWTPSGADDLEDLARGVLEGRRFRIHRHPSWRDGVIDVWRKRLTNDKGT